MGSVPWLGRSPGGGNGNPLQFSCLENPVDRGAWQATNHGVAKSWTRLKRLNTHSKCMYLRCVLIYRYTYEAITNQYNEHIPQPQKLLMPLCNLAPFPQAATNLPFSITD